MMTMIHRRIEIVAFPISFFDLFTQGLETLLARAVYYGMDLVLTAANFNMGMRDKDHAEHDLTLGFDEHNFLFDYVKFLVSQNLANIDFADCLVEWVNRELHPHFVAPLSARGRQLLDLISAKEDALVGVGLLGRDGKLRVCQEGYFEMAWQTYFARLPRIHAFQKVMLADKSA